MRLNKIILIVLALIIVTLGAVFFWPQSRPIDEAKPEAEARAALTITVARPEIANWPVVIPATGNIEAWQLATISPEISGVKITAVLADVGDQVVKGQVLARLADDTLKAQFDQQKAAVEKARAALLQAQANSRRARTLAGTGALSEQETADYNTAEKTAQAELALQNATLSTQQINLAYTAITAPDDGLIATRTATLGTMAQAGAALFTIVNQGRLEWRAAVPENQIELIGDDAKVRLTTLQGETIEGKIRLVAPTIDTLTRDGLVYVDLPNHPALKTGMFVKGDFEIGGRSAMTVPESAVVVDNGYSYVFKVQPDSTVKRSRVETGRRRDNRIEISAGMSGKDTLAADGAGFLNDGDKVSIANAQPRTEIPR